MRHKADRNEFLSAYSGTLSTSCIYNKKYPAMNDMPNDKWNGCE